MVRRARWAAACAGAGLMAVMGCGGGGQRTEGPMVVQRGPAPSYEQVAAAYNARVEVLESLWARSVIRFWYPDREGEERTEQVEGHFQYIRPRKVNLSLSKVGETAAMLGSNEERYWWIELGRGESRRAWVGEHSKATPERIAELGLPVYPLDLVELIGITPLPTDLPVVGPTGVAVRWGEGGRELVVNMPTRGGARRMYLDPESYEPQRIEIVDRDGRVVLSSVLSDYTTVALRKGAPDADRIRVPGEVLATVNQERTRVRLRLFDPETGGSRPKEAAFDFERLIESFNVRNVIDLDATPMARR